jgi:hypothetical protein
VKQLLAQGRKLEAIKLAREKTGFPLEAAKDMVELIEKGGHPSPDGLQDLSSMLRMAKDLSPEAPGWASRKPGRSSTGWGSAMPPGAGIEGP